jgi:hypothetical protein
VRAERARARRRSGSAGSGCGAGSKSSTAIFITSDSVGWQIFSTAAAGVTDT